MFGNVVIVFDVIYLPQQRFINRFEAANRGFKKTTTATATGTWLNKRFNQKNNGCARAL